MPLGLLPITMVLLNLARQCVRARQINPLFTDLKQKPVRSSAPGCLDRVQHVCTASMWGFSFAIPKELRWWSDSALSYTIWPNYYSKYLMVHACKLIKSTHTSTCAIPCVLLDVFCDSWIMQCPNWKAIIVIMGNNSQRHIPDANRLRYYH
jgi:hypothetical protein